MFKKIADAFMRYQKRRVAYIQLSNLSERELKDLGISRSELKQIINGNF
jgi:uncharacterized protein YjiS (DUF1127 family)